MIVRPAILGRILLDQGSLAPEALERAIADVKKAYEGQVPLGRGCRYDDIGNVVVFLASELSSYMTGQAINITGGDESDTEHALQRLRYDRSRVVLQEHGAVKTRDGPLGGGIEVASFWGGHGDRQDAGSTHHDDAVQSSVLGAGQRCGGSCTQGAHIAGVDEEFLVVGDPLAGQERNHGLCSLAATDITIKGDHRDTLDRKSTRLNSSHRT